MGTFFIFNRITKDRNWVEADNFADACYNLGWHEFDCENLPTDVDKVVDKSKNLIRVKMSKIPEGHFLKAIFFKENGEVGFQYWSPIQREKRLDELRQQAKKRKRDQNGRFKKEKLIF